MDMKKSIVPVVLMCMTFGMAAHAADITPVTQGDFNTAQRAYEEIRQGYTDISRASRVIQESNTAMWQRILDLEKRNAQLQEELTAYKSIIQAINSNLNRQGALPASGTQ